MLGYRTLVEARSKYPPTMYQVWYPNTPRKIACSHGMVSGQDRSTRPDMHITVAGR